MDKDKMDKVKLPDEDWSQLKKEMSEVREIWDGRRIDKFKENCRNHPLVPIGCCCTVAALSFGLVSLVRRKRQHSQYAMRARIVAQAFTFAAAIGATLITAVKAKAKGIEEQKENGKITSA